MPGVNTVFIDNLNKDDRVIICYAKNNTYYASEKNREKLSKSTKAEVIFDTIAPGSNAVDFAIAVKAGITAAFETESMICLISEDHHFERIANVIRNETAGNRNTIICGDTIRDAFVSDPSNIGDLRIVSKLMNSVFGDSSGKKIYSRMKQLYQEQFENEVMQKEQNVTVPMTVGDAVENLKKEEIKKMSFYSRIINWIK